MLLLPSVCMAEAASQSASELMTQAWNAASEQNTLKFKQSRTIQVINSMLYSWGKSYQSCDISYEESEGCRDYQSAQKYEHIRSGIPPTAGKSMVEWDNYEKVTSKDFIYLKAPTGVWIKSDEPTPSQFFESIGKSDEDIFEDIDLSMLADETMGGKDCKVVFFSYRPEFFEPLLEKLVEEQLALSEVEAETGKSIWEQVRKSQRVSGSGKVWIDKASGLEIHQESQFTVKFYVDIPMPDSQGHSMKYVYELQDSTREDRFDYGQPVNMPDVSRAMTMEEYLDAESRLFGGDVM